MNSQVLKEEMPLSLKSKEFISDPYPWYSWMRNNSPYLTVHGMTLLSRHVDVSCALLNPDLSPRSWVYHIKRICEKNQVVVPEKAGRFIEFTLLGLDEPLHRQWQTVMLKTFNSKLFENMREWAKEESEKLLSEKDKIDIINECTGFLWIKMFSRWLCLSQEQHIVIEKNLASLRLFVDPGELNESNLAKALSDVNDLIIALEDAQGNDNKSVESSFFGDLKAQGVPGADFSKTDVAIMAATILSGGGETVQTLSGSLFYYLSKDSKLIKSMIDDDKLIGSAINEVARLESPVQITQRYALKDTMINDFEVKKGERLLLCLGSANRDESVFGDSANLFDLTRKNAKTLAFSKGARHCIGSSMAKLIIESFLITFFKRNSFIEPESIVAVWQTKTSLIRALDKFVVKNNI